MIKFVNRVNAITSLAFLLTILTSALTSNAQSINVCEGVADNIFITDITNCSSYLICVNGQPIAQECRNGLYFDASTQSCVTSNSVCLTCNSNQLTSTALANTCNKYVLCFAGTPVLQQCADNLQFNPNLRACDLPKNVDCVSNYCSIYQNPNQIVYVASQSSCAKYFICMNGLPQNQTCISGLYFNKACNCCDLAANANCTITGSNKRTTYQTAAMIAPHMVDITCPAEGGIQFISHKNPNQYYMCVNGKGALMTCAATLYFDKEEGACRRQEDILKKLKFLLSVLLASTILAQLQAATNVVNICNGVSDNIFLPYVGNCSKYYICLAGEPIEQDCEFGYYFDAKDQSCTYQSVAQCLPTCTNALSSFCYDRTCTKYVLCYAGIPIIRECIDGLQYNAETDRCDFPQYVDCVDNMCTIFNNPNNITFLTSRAACDKYYICMDGTAYAQTCSNGLQFNTMCNCCDFPEKVNCNITTAAVRNIMPYSKSPPRRADIRCPTDGANFIAHSDPAKFYYCLNGMGVVLECTPGLVYDPNVATCRLPQNVSQ